MVEALELQGYWIDTVRPVHQKDMPPQEGDWDDQKPGVQMVRYSVLATDAEDALRRFFEDEAGVVSEETEPTDLVVVGISLAGAPGIA